MSDEKYKRTARNERREVQWHRRPRSTFRAALYPSQARMRTNHHLHQINSKHHLPGNKCNPREREKTPEGSIETTDKLLKVITGVINSRTCFYHSVIRLYFCMNCFMVSSNICFWIFFMFFSVLSNII